MKKALVVAAHPDDEVLGCGGTIARLSSEGWDVHIHIVAEGSTSRDDMRDTSKHAGTLSALRDAANEACRILGAASVAFSEMPDNRMDSVALLDIVKLVDIDIKTFAPQLVFTHHAGDVNVDHRIVHDAVIAATRPQPGFCVEQLLFFEVASSTEWRPAASGITFAPDTYFDIEIHLKKKLDALLAYAAEMRPFPHPRSIEAVEAIARWRGASVGRLAAEAFMLGRHIL
jgi:LmbE family N-acetylglucosaminyl deacetylase